MIFEVLSLPPTTMGSSGLIKCWLWSPLPHMPLGACSTPTLSPRSLSLLGSAHCEPFALETS